MGQIKNLSVRMDEELLRQLHRVAKWEERSVNAQVLHLIRNCVRQFEKEQGPEVRTETESS